MQPSQTFITPDRVTISGMTTNYGHPFIKVAKKVEQTIPNPNGTSKGLFTLSHRSLQWIKNTYPIDVHPHLSTSPFWLCHVTQKNRTELTFSAEFFLYKELNEYRESGGGSQGKWDKDRKRGRVGFPVQEILLCDTLIGWGGFIGILQQPVRIRLFSALEVCAA